ncbi:hypothetical protein HY988_00455 [Candidatus Micrarchaeota archaeon]|nr:hypothetical protein [Candidatus Micrarchaeota archaeon]
MTTLRQTVLQSAALLNGVSISTTEKRNHRTILENLINTTPGALALRAHLNSHHSKVKRLSVAWNDEKGMTIQEVGVHIARGGHFGIVLNDDRVTIRPIVYTPMFDLMLLDRIGTAEAYYELSKLRAVVVGILELDFDFLSEKFGREVQRVVDRMDAILESRLDGRTLTVLESSEITLFELEWKRHPPTIKDEQSQV